MIKCSVGVGVSLNYKLTSRLNKYMIAEVRVSMSSVLSHLSLSKQKGVLHGSSSSMCT